LITPHHHHHHHFQEKDGASPLLLVELRRADGETSQGVATSLVVRNTDRLRSGLRYARGLDAQDLVDDLVHLYWTFLQVTSVFGVGLGSLGLG